jgi:hypothetical protein
VSLSDRLGLVRHTLSFRRGSTSVVQARYTHMPAGLMRDGWHTPQGHRGGYLCQFGSTKPPLTNPVPCRQHAGRFKVSKTLRKRRRGKQDQNKLRPWPSNSTSCSCPLPTTPSPAAQAHIPYLVWHEGSRRKQTPAMMVTGRDAHIAAPVVLHNPVCGVLGERRGEGRKRGGSNLLDMPCELLWLPF